MASWNLAAELLSEPQFPLPRGVIFLPVCPCGYEIMERKAFCKLESAMYINVWKGRDFLLSNEEAIILEERPLFEKELDGGGRDTGTKN